MHVYFTILHLILTIYTEQLKNTHYCLDSCKPQSCPGNSFNKTESFLKRNSATNKIIQFHYHFMNLKVCTIHKLHFLYITSLCGLKVIKGFAVLSNEFIIIIFSKCTWKKFTSVQLRCRFCLFIVMVYKSICMLRPIPVHQVEREKSVPPPL